MFVIIGIAISSDLHHQRIFVASFRSKIKSCNKLLSCIFRPTSLQLSNVLYDSNVITYLFLYFHSYLNDFWIVNYHDSWTINRVFPLFDRIWSLSSLFCRHLIPFYRSCWFNVWLMSFVEKSGIDSIRQKHTDPDNRKAFIKPWSVGRWGVPPFLLACQPNTRQR